MRYGGSRAGMFAAALACVALAGCAAAPRATEEVRAAASPGARPARAVTDFSGALRCMDDLLARHAVRDIVVTAQGVPDQTGKVAAGTKDMLITAISTMSTRSRAVRFVAYGSDIADILDLRNAHAAGATFEVPDFFIRGGITQLDEAVIKAQAGATVNPVLAQLGVKSDEVVSLVSLDMNMGRVRDLQIVSGVNASNSLAVIRRDTGLSAGSEVGGVINKAGISFELSFARSEGVHQAVRTLIDLSAVELFGKLARVPYWECLGIGSAHPLAADQRRAWQSGRNEVDEARQARSAAPPRAAGTTDSQPPAPQSLSRSLAVAIEQQIGRELNEADRTAIDLQLRRLLDSSESGGQRVWQSAIGNSGSFASAEATAREGQPCKAIEHRQQIGSQRHAGYLLLCAARDGGWDVAESRARTLDAAPPVPRPGSPSPTPSPPRRSLDDTDRFPTRRP